MRAREPEASWLGAEALPGGLAEINRVYLTAKSAAAGGRGADRSPRRPGWIASAVRWLKNSRSSLW